MLDYRTETFLTLYEEMNYRRTAERLQMTQPGVTQHIHYIENYYGVKLFIYDGHRLLGFITHLNPLYLLIGKGIKQQSISFACAKRRQSWDS